MSPMTRSIRWTRVSAATTAAALLALAGPAWPAAADGGGLGGVPPPLVGGFLPDRAAPTPPYSYQPKRECVQTVDNMAPADKPPWGQQDLRIEDAWRFATGVGQRVAVVDTGVAPNEAIRDRLVPGGDYVVANGDGTSDCDGHGTAVAGIIGARTSSGVGFKGVAPDAQIIAIRQSSAYYSYRGDDGSDHNAGNVLTLAEAIRTAVDLRATVINVSIAACFPPAVDAGQDAYQRALQAAVHYAMQQNVVVVVAAGNVGTAPCTKQNDDFGLNTIASPAWYHGDVLTVGAVQDVPVPGPAGFTLAGPWVDVAAPGTRIVSLAPTSSGLATRISDSPDGPSGPIQGTSFAAPYVAGLAALVRERFPNLNASQVMDRIKMTAQHPAGNGGRNNQVGYGVVNPIAALTEVLPQEQPGFQPAPSSVMRTDLSAQQGKNSTAMRIAMIGSGSGIGLIGVTLFVVHAVRRARTRAGQFAQVPRPRL